MKYITGFIAEWFKAFIFFLVIGLGYLYVQSLITYPWPTIVYTLVAIVVGAFLLDWWSKE